MPKQRIGPTVRVWLAAIVGLTPLLITLGVQSAVGLAALPLLLSTFASTVVGSAAVVAIARRASTGEASVAFGSRSGSASTQEEESRDPLTGLPTFQPFSRRLLHEFQHVQREGSRAAVVVADISQLSKINDEFNNTVGDEALKHVATCLTRTKRGNDVVARVGDDEFALLLPGCDEAGAEAFVKRAQSRLSDQPLRASSGGREYTLWVGLCAGIAVCDGDANGADDVLTTAIESLRVQRTERDLRQSRWATAA